MDRGGIQPQRRRARRQRQRADLQPGRGQGEQHLGADIVPGTARLFDLGRLQAGHEHFLHGPGHNIYTLMVNN